MGFVDIFGHKFRRQVLCVIKELLKVLNLEQQPKQTLLTVKRPRFDFWDYVASDYREEKNLYYLKINMFICQFP